MQMDKSWVETPFLRHRMLITEHRQIDALRACGVKILEVDDGPEEHSGADTAWVPPPEAISDQPVIDQPPEPEPSREFPATSFEEELTTARQVYKAAKHIIEDAMLDVRMGRDINMEAVNSVVAGMADSVLRNPDALTSLSRVKRFDEYTFYHSVNTSLLALALGRNLGFDRGGLHQLGVGTLLHDIGKTKIPLEILNKPGRFEAKEFEIMQQHVMHGVEILSTTTGLDEPFFKPTLEHHERVDGTGYPHRRKKSDLSEYGLIAAVVDIYDAVTSDRCYHKAKPPHEALQFLYQLGQRGHVDSRLVQRFIQIVGVYPVGSCVGLNTGETAIVRKLNHDKPLEPHVIIVKSAGNTLLSKPEELDLSTQVRRPHRSIQSALNPLTLGINPSVYLDKELI